MTQNLRIVGIDRAKSVFHLAGMDVRGKIILRKRLMRGEVLAFMATLPPVTVTAQKAPEDPHDVPVSVTAVTHDMLDAARNLDITWAIAGPAAAFEERCDEGA